MASLFNTRISDTYSGLIKTIDNAAITASLKEITDGNGTGTGLFVNNAGDFKVTAILEFGSLKDTGENITITKFVDEADGIANNDNDTTIPTTAAIIDYVAAQITIEDLDFTGDSGSGQIDLDSQIFAINGTANEITTVASGQSITFSLNSTGVVLPNNSTATTQTAGDNSTKIATTSYVDTLDAASDLDFSGDSGTGDVNLNTQVLAITGTANQIESTASGQGLSLQFPSAGVTLPNGSVATTQASSDDSTKVATTAYVKGLNNASDLDFTTDSGSGAVVLNSQTLSVLGTTNEIETSGSGQAVTIGLPSTINVNVTGNLTGNVTGNVTGDLTGNADTATKWQTARDLSLTGQATGTISSVDGSGNVSGAVTLDNNSVTAKVLTGLTSPSASSVLATDTILEGFGKVQSQINGLAGGLRFMGDWNATTNSPVLSSGGGEAANGTTTSTTANKLVDSSASFTSTVTVGDQVVNQVDGQTALVSNVDSDTTLSLSADIMLTGEAYTIDNSPFITQGHYYVVSVGGTTSLNGISNWSVGDWVIAGANNQWTKLDHSQVDGTGTAGNLTKWASTSVIADSIVSESGTAITVDGSLATNSFLNSTGNFSVNTDKFTVAASSGDTAIAGNLDFPNLSDILIVDNSSAALEFKEGSNLYLRFVTTNGAEKIEINKNIEAQGITATSATFTGNVNLGDNDKLILGTGNDLQIYHDGGNSKITEGGTGGLYIGSSLLGIESGNHGETMAQFIADGAVKLYYDNVQKFQTTSTGISITSEATVGDGTDGVKFSYSGGNSSGIIDTGFSSTALEFRVGNTQELLINGTSATFAGDVQASGIYVGATNTSFDFYNQGTSYFNGTVTVDAAFTQSGGDASTFSGSVTFDNVISGVRGSFVSTAAGLTVLSSEGAYSSSGSVKLFEAKRSGGAVASDWSYDDATTDMSLGTSTGHSFSLKTNNTRALTINSSQNVGMGNGSDTINSDAVLTLRTTGFAGLDFKSARGAGNNIGGTRFYDSNSDTVAVAQFLVETDGSYNFYNGANGAENRMRISPSGNVGIGQAPSDFADWRVLELKGLTNGSMLNFENSSSVRTGAIAMNDASSLMRLQTMTASGISFEPNNAEAMRIDSNGAVGIGRNTASYKLSLISDATVANGVYISAGTGNGNHALYVEDKDGTAEYFAVRGDGQIRMGASGVGDVLIGKTALNNDDVGIWLNGDGTSWFTANSDYPVGINRKGTDGNVMVFTNDQATAGSISVSGTSTSYNTSSDYRLKEDLQDFAGLDMVSKIPVYDFKWKSDESRSYGVMAHELQEVLPQAVVGEKDAEKMQEVDYSKIVPLLLKSIQELKAEVDKLKQECKCK